MKEEKPAPCEFLPWDTKFFGHRTARMCSDALDEAAASEVDKWSTENRIEVLYFLARAGDPRTIETAERHGFGLVDVRMTYELSQSQATKPGLLNTSSREDIRDMVRDDVDALRIIAKTAHSDTRFFSDPRFDRQKASKLYETWIEKECAGQADKVLVATSAEGKAIGYLSGHLNRASFAGTIGLVGVSKEYQGRGLGNRLVRAALEWFLAQGMQQVTVVTQAKNLAAQRLYQRCGFLIQNVQLWYHKWYPPGALKTDVKPNRAKKSA